jgi:hypothetical protein
VFELATRSSALAVALVIFIPDNEMVRRPLVSTAVVSASPCFELRDWIQFLERRGEGVGEAPDCPWPELLAFRFEVEVMHGRSQMLWSFESAFYERLVDDHLAVTSVSSLL